MAYKTDSCKANHVINARESFNAGDYCIDSTRRSLIFVCPGCKTAGEIHIDGKGPANKNWTMTGSDDCPTLHPSLHHIGCWHGWLKSGQFESC